MNEIEHLEWYDLGHVGWVWVVKTPEMDDSRMVYYQTVETDDQVFAMHMRRFNDLRQDIK